LRDNLPEVAELRQIADDKAKVRDRVITAQTQASDIKREQDKLEADIEQVRRRMSRDQERLDQGSVSAARELGNLQHEIASLQKRQRDLEDVELEVMERLEVVDTELTALQSEQERLELAETDAEFRRVAALTDIETNHSQASKERTDVVVTIGAELLALYEKLRAQYGGVAAVAIKRRRCDGCRLEINATDLGRLRNAADDAVLRCEECRRIQVRSAESGL